VTDFSKVFLKPPVAEPELLDLPTASGPSLKATAKALDSTPMDVEQTQTPENFNLVTYSDVPRSKWQTLANLELIMERNKPIQPPKVPEKAPFFLPTLPGQESKFITPKNDNNNIETPTKSKILNFAKLQPATAMRVLLEKGKVTTNYSELVTHIKESSPSLIDFEVRSLSMMNDYEDLKLFIRFLLHELDTNTNFEMIQALLSLFLKVHADTIVMNQELSELTLELKEKQRIFWVRLQRMFQQNICLISYVSNIQF